ncbi:MAG TPA: hypothetical protein VER33_06215 [Polyangiaceae bacterium]|nr:hypothetical protein [Polyangiaceae bacterium]
MSLTAYLLTAIASLPTYREDIGPEFAEQKLQQSQMVAEAINEAVDGAENWSGTRRELATLMLTVAWHETRLSLRIHDGRCKPLECDRGRARGLWQLQVQRSLPREQWLKVAGFEPEPTRIAAREAVKMLVRSRRMCSVVTRGRDWVAPTLTAYAGCGCGGKLPDLNARVRTFRMLLNVTPEKGTT